MPWIPTDDPSTPKPRGKWVPVDKSRGDLALDPSTLHPPSGPTEMRAGPSPLVRGTEEAGATVAGLGGAALGAMGTGPAAPVGGALGWTAGKTAADILNAKINEWIYGTPTDLSRKNLEGEVSANLGGGLVGEATAGVINPIASKALSGLAGEGEVVAAGREAAENVGAQNAKELEKLQKGAQAERLQQKTATARAAQKQGEANQAERLSTFGKAEAARAKEGEQLVGAKEKFASGVQTQLDKRDAAMQKAREQLVKPTVEDARAEAAQAAVGKGQEASMEQGPERIARGQNFRDTILNPLQKWREDWASRYESKIGDAGINPVDDSRLRGVIAKDQAEWGTQNRPLSPKMNAFIKKIVPPETLGEKPFKVDTASDIAVKEGELTPAEALRQRRAINEDMFRKRGMNIPEGEGGTIFHEGGKLKTVNDFIKLRREATTLARTEQGPNRTLANRIVNGIDDTLTEMKLPTPELNKLNAEYRDHRLNFPYAFEDTIQKTARPVDAAKEIFTVNPQRALDLAKFGTPETKTQLLQLYADAVKSDGLKFIDKPEHPKILQALGVQGPLAKPESWFYFDKAVHTDLPEIFDHSPQAQAKYNAAIQKAWQEEKADYAKTIIRDAYQDSAKLGATGSRIKAAIDAAKTPDEKVQVALKAFQGLDPSMAESPTGSQAIAGLSQKSVGTAAREAQMGAPHGARQALGAFQPADPKAAAMDAMKQFGGWGQFANRWKRRAEFWAPLAIGGVAVGHPSTYAGAGLALGVPILAREGLAAGYRYTMRQSPAMMEQLYRQVINPGSPGNLDAIARTIVKGTLDEGVSQGAKAIGGVSLEKQPPPKTKGTPMADAVDVSHARMVAGAGASPEKVEKVMDVHQQIAKGNTPNVSDDLRSGRLSTNEIRKMVAPSPTSVASMFDNMSVEDAVSAFSKGTQEERDMALPAIVQKIQNEGTRLPKEQLASIFNVLRKAIQPEAQTGVEG